MKKLYSGLNSVGEIKEKINEIVDYINEWEGKPLELPKEESKIKVCFHGVVGYCMECEPKEKSLRDAEYELISRRCVNSTWVAKFLTREDEECCQCPFGCFVKVKLKKSGYEYVVSADDYKNII